ncbi:MAG TPA: hypothetical protein VGD78_23205 [Chthoniobacterales bacterium]
MAPGRPCPACGCRPDGRRAAIKGVYGWGVEIRAILAEDAEIDAVAVSADYAQQGEIAADLLRAGKRDGAPFESSGHDASIDVWAFEQIYQKHLGSRG